MRLIKAILLTAALATAAWGQSPDKVLKMAEKALGGTKALQAIKASSRTGRVTRVSDGASGSYTSAAAEPNLFNEDIEINGFETETGTNGRSGWSRNSRDGLQTLTAEASVLMRALAAY